MMSKECVDMNPSNRIAIRDFIYATNHHDVEHTPRPMFIIHECIKMNLLINGLSKRLEILSFSGGLQATVYKGRVEEISLAISVLQPVRFRLEYSIDRRPGQHNKFSLTKRDLSSSVGVRDVDIACKVAIFVAHCQSEDGVLHIVQTPALERTPNNVEHGTQRAKAESMRSRKYVLPVWRITVGPLNLKFG
jgi:hypothetical protein